MSTKLTLVMEAAVIETAKDYARRQNTSVSKLVERYLALISSAGTSLDSRQPKLGPLTSALAGAVKPRAEDASKSTEELIGEARLERFG